MATIQVPKPPKMTTINKFLGLNEDTTGELELKLGESSLMPNYRLTENYKLSMREGYKQLFGSLGAHSTRGIWYGKIGGEYRFLFACNGHVWLKQALSDTDYDSLDDTTYTHVDMVKTTALNTAVVGTSGVDGFTIYLNRLGNDSTEIAAADIDQAASAGKYYYHTDGTVWIIVAKGTYADIAAARTGLETSTAYVQIGDVTDATTFFFNFDDKVYLLNGAEYKYFDGSTFDTVAGYVPLIATATPPAGGGTTNEQINLLTGKKKQSFSADGTATAYQCAETGLTSIDVVTVDGATKALTTDYTVDLPNGKVNFVSAPATGVDNVVIQWTKGTGSRAEITAHRFAMFYGGRNDSRVFLYGDGSNRYYYSGLADGVPSAEYFPALNYREISSNEFAVTDIIRQYDRQLIFTNGGETWYSYYDPITVNNETIADFPTFTLNDAIGNVAIGQAQLIQNNPFSIQNGIHEWVATNVRDERNAVYKSKRVESSLAEVDLSTALTIDWEAKKEYWLAIGTDVWIYNYRLDAWYRFILHDAPTCFYVADNELYFGTAQGQIMKFDKTKLSDNGTAFTARWEMNFYDFDAEYLQKLLSEMWITLQPKPKSSVNLYFQTDIDGVTLIGTAVYNLSTFGAVNLTNWSFLTNYNPQPVYFKMRAKKFVYLKIILINSEIDEELTILSLNLPARYGSKTR